MGRGDVGIVSDLRNGCDRRRKLDISCCCGRRGADEEFHRSPRRVCAARISPTSADSDLVRISRGWGYRSLSASMRNAVGRRSAEDRGSEILSTLPIAIPGGRASGRASRRGHTCKDSRSCRPGVITSTRWGNETARGVMDPSIEHSGRVDETASPEGRCFGADSNVARHRRAGRAFFTAPERHTCHSSGMGGSAGSITVFPRR